MKIIKYDDSNYDRFLVEHTQSNGKRTIMPDEHHHDGYEFYFYLGEGMTYIIDSDQYTINKYDLVYIEKRVYHRTIYWTNREERILFTFKESVFDVVSDKTPIYDALKRIAQTPKMTFDKGSKDWIQSAMSDIVAENIQGNELLLKLDLVNFILKVDKLIERGHLSPSVDVKTDSDTKITDIIDYLLKNYSSKITLDELEKKFFISKYHLCRRFKEATGQTIVNFLNEKRLVEACQLLISTDRSVRDIAVMTGFESVNHFNELFKKKYGLTPYKYKQREKDENR